jgi:hypothetical protein
MRWQVLGNNATFYGLDTEPESEPERNRNLSMSEQEPQ